MAAKSPEERAAWIEQIRKANLGKKRAPEAIKKFRKTVAARTPIEKEITAVKRRAAREAMPPEVKKAISQRVSASFRATWEAKPVEERQAHQQAILEVWALRTPEEKAVIAAKISAGLTGKKMSHEAIEKNRAKGIGKKASLETRQKMSRSQTGKKMSQECLDKRAATWAAKSPEEKAEIAAKSWATRRAKGK
jgi:hypothetical protein